ncbi:MAG: hypothetical protein H7839_19075 [Magnetococcus sp. YQC-5]
MAINIQSINYWEAELTFLDVMKRAFRWYTYCPSNDPRCTPPAPAHFWDTLEQSKLDLDAQGWVRSLPAADSQDVYYRSVYTHMFWDQGASYPAGQYIVLYEGEGTIHYGYNGVKKNQSLSKPGRDVLDVVPDDMGIQIMILATNPANHLRNIRVIMPGGICGTDPFTSYDRAADCPSGTTFQSYETLYETLRFYPHFLRDLRAYRSIRYMTMMNIVQNTTSKWEQRARLNDAIWSTNRGVPPEILMALSNAVMADPWFNMPFQADDDYVRQFATMAKARLRDNLKIYVEYGNEIWNDDPLFPQGRWVEEQAKARWPNVTDADLKKLESWHDNNLLKRVNWQGMRTAQMCDIWREVFGEQSNRIVCLVASQSVREYMFDYMLECPLYARENQGKSCAKSINAMAIGSYFGYHVGTKQFAPVVQTWIDSDPDGGLNTLFKELFEGGPLYDPKFEPVWARAPIHGPLAEISQWVDTNLVIAKKYGFQLLATEGGQHLGGPGSDENNAPLQNLFNRANRDPRMATAYQKMLNSWKEHGGGMLALFLNVNRPTKWGNWGLKEYQNQPREQAIKFNAVMDFIAVFYINFQIVT